MLYRKPFVRLLQLLALCLLCAQAQAFDIKPFSAAYTADWTPVPVSGSAERSLQSIGKGQWQLQFNASMLVAKLTEKSTFDYGSGEIRPLSYSYSRGGFGSGKGTDLGFDWKNKQVRDKRHNKALDVPLDQGLLDKSSYQLALQADVADGHKSMSYKVLDKDEVETYDFRVIGQEAVETKVGKIDAIKVERVRDPTQSKRRTTIWLAKDWDYLLVALSQVEKDGKEYRIVLKDGTVDGRPVKGK